MNQPQSVPAVPPGEIVTLPFARPRRAALPVWMWRDVLAPFLATRLILAVVGFLAIKLMVTFVHPLVFNVSSQTFVNEWTRWDARWYLMIAHDGYWYRPGVQTPTAFWPLYPMLMRLVAGVVGRGDYAALAVAGIVVANAALLTAAGYLAALVRLDHDEETAARAVFYLFLFPTSLFLSAVYSDSLFLALVVAAFYQARRQRWLWAGVLCGLATLTRPHGLFLFVPLVFEYLAQRDFQWRRVRADALPLLLAPAAYLGWAFYLYHLSGVINQVCTASGPWGRHMMPPWDTFRLFLSGPLTYHDGSHSFLDLCFSLLFLPLVVAARRLRPSYALYAVILYVIMLSTGQLVAVMRYGLSLFPVFLVLALAGRHAWFDRAYVAVAATLSGLFMVLFAGWYWLA